MENDIDFELQFDFDDFDCELFNPQEWDDFDQAVAEFFETVEEKERQKKREDEMKLQNSAGDNEFSAGVHDDEHSSILQLFESSKRKREVEVQTEEVPSSPKKRKTRRETL